MKRDLPSIIGQLTVSCLAFLVSGVALGQPASPPPGLRPSEPIVCSGNRDLTLRGRYIAADHTATQIQGNCDVYLIDCYVVAGGVAIQASGNSGVHIVGSTIEGAGGSATADRGNVFPMGASELMYVTETS